MFYILAIWTILGNFINFLFEYCLFLYCFFKFFFSQQYLELLLSSICLSHFCLFISHYSTVGDLFWPIFFNITSHNFIHSLAHSNIYVVHVYKFYSFYLKLSGLWFVVYCFSLQFLFCIKRPLHPSCKHCQEWRRHARISYL